MKLHRLILTVMPLGFAAGTLMGAEKLMTVQQEKAYGEPTDATAIVYVVRPAFVGKAVRSWAFMDQEPLGVNKGKHYTFAEVEPGTHLFWTRAENTSALELEIQAGKTYYLKQKVKAGAMKARVKLLELDEAEGKAAIEKCKYTQLTAAGEARAREIIEARYETALGKVDDADGEDGP